jgi:hypothetical protein
MDGPTVLITTDVSAEGLDLQAAARVIHYDLPWTSVRIEQRDGRALRLGSRHERVEVVRFESPPAIERRLRQLEILARKRRLPRRAGIDNHGMREWTWGDQVSRRFGAETPASRPLFCAVRSSQEGLLIGVSLVAMESDNRQRRLAAIVSYLDARGTWSDQPDLVAERFQAALSGTPIESGPTLDSTRLKLIGTMVGERLRSLLEGRWRHHWSPVQVRLVNRLNRLAAAAVRERNAEQLAEVERAINSARRGHTAGEDLLLGNLVKLSDRAMLKGLTDIPPDEPRFSAVFARLTGVVVFQK